MNRPEEALQRSLVRHLQQRLAPPWMFFHVPNGGGRSKAEGGIFKAIGVRAGIPDLILIGEGRMVCLECKSDKGRLTPKQRETIAALAAAGAPTMIVRSVDQGLEALAAMGVPMQGRVAGSVIPELANLSAMSRIGREP